MDPVIVVALIGFVPSTIAALATLRSSKAITEARDIVKGNGRGTVTAMVSDLQDTVAEHGFRLDRLRTWQSEHTEEHLRMGERDN